MTASTLQPTRIRTAPALAASASIGALAAVQARINGQLGLRLDDGLTAASISFGSGLVIVAILSLSIPAGRRGLRSLLDGVRARRIPWWMLLPGVAGALTVATQGLAVGIIGVALFTVGFVAGQVIFGLLLDRIGFGPGGIVPVTWARLIGGVLALGAVGVSLAAGSSAVGHWWLLIMPFLAGSGVAWQQAANGRLRARVGSALTTTLMNFLAGTVVLLIATAMHGALVHPPAPPPSEWWLYIGGSMGVVYIFIAANLVEHTGVLLLGLGSVAGQLAMSVVVDTGWPTPASPDLPHELAMVAVALISVVVASVPWGQTRAAHVR
ncbi:MAG: DMT family transporter [Micropruina sp.]